MVGTLSTPNQAVNVSGNSLWVLFLGGSASVLCAVPLVYWHRNRNRKPRLRHYTRGDNHTIHSNSSGGGSSYSSGGDFGGGSSSGGGGGGSW